MTPESDSTTPAGKTRLGAFDIACVVIGGIIGIGIFFTPAQVARSVDAPWQVSVAWSLGGAIAILGALVFARMSRLATGPGGVFEYILQSFGSRPAFLYGWCLLMITQSGALAFVALLLVSNLEKALVCQFSTFWQHMIATAVLLGLTLVNIAGLKLGKGVQNALTVIKTLAVFSIVVVAILVSPAEPSAAIPVAEPAREAVGFFVAMSAAMLPVLFSFGGWHHGSFVASVARNPHRDVPLGIVGGVLVVVIAYVGVNLAYLELLGFDQASQSSTIAVDAMQAAFATGDAAQSKVAQVFAALIVLSAAGLMNTICMAPPYVLHTMANRGLF
ncbi:MAG: amino acid permease, partial [Planctomycetota bacterium]|nr:amino acid permease [Planctomycetota bacterium]